MPSDDKIMIVPVGGSEPMHFSSQLEAAVRLYDRHPEIHLESLPLTSDLYETLRNQYMADRIIQKVWETYRLKGSSKILAVTSRDVFVPKLNFVFGLADRDRGVAILSTARLTSLTHTATFLSNVIEERVFKEAAHEVGHLCGLEHCLASETCIMTFANSLSDVDAKLPILCTSCLRKIPSHA